MFNDLGGAQASEEFRVSGFFVIGVVFGKNDCGDLVVGHQAEPQSMGDDVSQPISFQSLGDSDVPNRNLEFLLSP